MKKKLIAILLVVAMVAALSVGLAACNKDKNTEPAKPSNAETLGTAVAVAANYAGAGASAAADEEAAKEGFNLDFGTNAGVGLAFNTALKSSLESMIANGIDNAEMFINENGVKVEKVTSDDKDFAVEYKITVTYTDKETNKEASRVYSLYINATKVNSTEAADVDGTEDYNFTAELKLGTTASFAFSGTAKYDKELDGMKFVLKIGVADSEGNVAVGVEVSASATKEGNIVVGVNAKVASLAKASVTLEIGKMADKQYGVDVKVEAEVLDKTVTAKVEVKAIAASADTDTFTVTGGVEATVTVPLVGTAKVNANVTGKAEYKEDTANNTSEIVLSVSGTANVSFANANS